jgi:hypothetical protein
MAKQKTAKQKSPKPVAKARKQPAKRPSTAKKAARKVALPKARKTAKRAAAKQVAKKAPIARPKPRKPATRRDRKAPTPLGSEQIETTSAGIQALAPEHAAVDDMTSSGNELLDIFQRYDRNRTGSIERGEFARLLEALGQNITDEELEIAIDIVDTDRTGKISWREFKNWWTSR